MSQKKIALVERLYHHDTILMMREYFAEAGYDCKYIVGEYVYRHMDDKQTPAIVLHQPHRVQRGSGRQTQSGNIRTRLRLTILVRREMQRNIRQSYRHIRRGSYDHIYLNTTNKFFLRPMGLLFLFQRSKLIAMLHNTNLRIRGVSLREAWTSIFLQLFYRQVPVFVLLGAYIYLPRCVRHGQHIYTLNRIVKERSDIIQRNPTSPLRVFIPGAIIPGRRNEQAIYDIIKSCGTSNITFHLMTGKRDEQIRGQLEAHQIDHCIQTHPGFISEDDYKKLFQQADVTLLVIDQSNPDYGYYQITGTLGDAFAYGGVVFLPKRYAPSHDFGPGVVRYTDALVTNQLAGYTQKENLQRAMYGTTYKKEHVVHCIQKGLERL